MEIPESVVRYFQTAPLSEAECVSQMMALMVAGRRAEQPVKVTVVPQTVRSARRHPVGKKNPNSIPAQVEELLRAASRPMSVRELIDGLQSHFNRTVAATVMRSEMYKKSKAPNNRFSRVGEGLFGLPEWEAELPLDQGSSPAQNGA